MSGLDYNKVVGNATMKAKVVDECKAGVLLHMPTGYTKNHIDLTLSAGSVKASYSITPLPGSDIAALTATVTSKKDAFKTSVASKVKAMPEVSAILEAGKTIADLVVTATDPVTVSVSVPIVTTTLLLESKFGFTVNDKVSWKFSDPRVLTAGTIGTVVGFKGEHVIVQFPGGRWSFDPSELIKEAHDAVSRVGRTTSHSVAFALIGFEILRIVLWA